MQDIFICFLGWFYSGRFICLKAVYLQKRPHWLCLITGLECKNLLIVQVKVPAISPLFHFTVPNFLARTSLHGLQLGGPKDSREVTAKVFLLFIREVRTPLKTVRSVLQLPTHPLGPGDKWLLPGEWPRSTFHLSYCSSPSCGEEEEKEVKCIVTCELALHFSQRQTIGYQWIPHQASKCYVASPEAV